MGQHKHNPTAIAARNGELPPRPAEKRLTKRQSEYLLRRMILNAMHADALLPEGMAEIIAKGVDFK